MKPYYIQSFDYIYPVGGDLDWDPDGRNVFMVREGVRNYKGEGLAVSAGAHQRQLAPNLERMDRWLKDAWSHYQRVCKISSSEPL